MADAGADSFDFAFGLELLSADGIADPLVCDFEFEV